MNVNHKHFRLQRTLEMKIEAGNEGKIDCLSNENRRQSRKIEALGRNMVESLEQFNLQTKAFCYAAAVKMMMLKISF
ncbi:CLUMA_CG004674, isoform A [Clunio marinus]|uniref:CLUMA_CG004674, isoform A n=1 Tax=Clunio marinus TaxID=568069 RepID=A0A1J1HTV1_9DIPT|nr:CLUMA_CG004674, isoform A [Clunio marinus]